MPPQQLALWQRKREKGRSYFVLSRGGSMAVLYFIGFVLLFGGALRFLLHEDMQWRYLLTITGFGSIGFGLILSWYVWHRLEADYGFTLDTLRAVTVESKHCSPETADRMKSLNVGEWHLSYDREATAGAYAEADEKFDEKCACDYCVNWRAGGVGVFPAAFRTLLDTLGIPFGHEAEVYQTCRLPSGLHLYGGWFHFVGRIESTPSTSQTAHSTDFFAEPGEPKCYGAFHTRVNLVRPTFGSEPLVQLEFYTEVPWLIDAPDPDRPPT